MERRKEIRRAKPGPAKHPKALKPFVAVDFTNNPWSLCRPENQEVILITYGHIAKYARMLTANMTDGDRYLLLNERRIHRFRDRRSIEIHLKTMRGQAVTGGWIRLRNARGTSVKINDVKGMFQDNWPKTVRRFQCDDPAAIMERVRSSLNAVGIKASQGNWYKCASLTDYLWNKHQINLRDVPAVSAPKGPGNLMGYTVFGHTDEPVYFYDINSAYLSVMAEFPALQPFTDHLWNARRELKEAGDPSEFLLKIAATIISGKFNSVFKHNKYYRPILGNYIRQTVNQRLQKAMDVANTREGPNWSNVYRYCVDGFIANNDISHLMDTGNELGQWKPVERRNGLTICNTNVWWSDGYVKTGGYNVNEQQVLDALATDEEGFPIQTSRTVFDWDRLEEHVDPIILRQRHEGLGLCRKCWEEDGQELHDVLGR